MTSNFARHLSADVSAPASALPADKRVPFGWSAATVGAVTVGAAPVVLQWPDGCAADAPTHLRFAVALDVRDEKRVEALLPRTDRVIGSFDVRFSGAFAVHHIALAPTDIAGIREQGVALRLASGSELHILSAGAGMPAELTPHLLCAGEADKTVEWERRFLSGACIQPFSWTLGCVTDGMLDMAALTGRAVWRATARAYLDRYVESGTLIYQDPRGVRLEGKLSTIETTLPFAALAQLEPQHPTLELALQFWRERRTAEDAVIDGAHTSSEGAYTVAYPMAVVAQIRDDEALQTLALRQLQVRWERLFDEQTQTFWRTLNGDGSRGNRNWARGVAWQLLGMARTLRVLPGHPDAPPLIEKFAELANWAHRFQRADGLWSVFVDEAEVAPDTSGSAGLAAAFAMGANAGWLDDSLRVCARQTLDGLQPYLTADGFLAGVAQLNKGGEALQRAPYRVISPMAMGLMAQLQAALGERV